MKKIYWLSLLALIVVTKVFAQDVLSSAQLQEDLSIIGAIAIELSPKATKEDQTRIARLIKKKKAELDGKEMTGIEFFNFLSEIDFQTKFDEHAALSISEEVLMPLLVEGKLFPFPVKIIGNSVVVNSLNAEIPYGAKILSINGVGIDTLLHSFTPRYKDTFVKRRLETQFPIMLLLKKGSIENFDVEYTTLANLDKFEKSIPGIGFETYISVLSETVFPLEPSKSDKLLNTHFFAEANTYYLQLNSFDWDDYDQKGLFHFLNAEHKNFEKKFKAIFKEVADYGAKNLIIDLRFNYGGNIKVPGILYSHIAKEPFKEDITISIQDFDIPSIELIKQISSNEIEDKSEAEKYINLFKEQFDQRGDASYTLKVLENEEVEPSSSAFSGNVYLMVSGRSVSASSYFAALFKANERGVIVGEEMGGSFRSLTAGQILTYQLPNSRIELEVPMMEVNFSDVLYEKIGTEIIKPDLEFSEEEHWRFFLAQKDIEMEKILEHIKQEEK